MLSVLQLEMSRIEERQRKEENEKGRERVVREWSVVPEMTFLVLFTLRYPQAVDRTFKSNY